jgi:diguanylate cyclase (GGDEF)-like protein
MGSRRIVWVLSSLGAAMFCWGYFVGDDGLFPLERFLCAVVSLGVGCVFASHLSATQRRMHRLYQRAIRDPLTAAFNRRGFFEEFKRRLRAARAFGHDLAIIVIDIDEFKVINDEYGHAAGDTILRGVYRAVQLSVREQDVVARMGGDEFLVVLSGVGCDNVQLVAERICSNVGDTEYTRPGAPRVTASVGGAFVETIADVPVGVAAKALLRVADRSLYSAKEAGRNRVVVERLVCDAKGSLRAESVGVAEMRFSDTESGQIPKQSVG